ncbi:hypothetical protein K469DRAFT_103237 [Zopfia rhizophila CBS 207.26]|uniref:Transposase Tc1-like domain-containing protein n=1 Tax=Zopfia rhizophila CBS 207.26 TaxID=1314779 RepID=A0A6A6ECU8_9PEZI|nr:hypothetical protein K469DRAFT_103237 [Zopfia rhizophila CBS 207.26]
MEPSTPHTKHLTRDECLQVQTLHLAGHPIRSIAALLNFTQRQVQYAAASQRVTPKKRSGRPQTLTSAQIDEIELASGPFSQFHVSSYAIRHALRQRGYSRCVALAKPPLSPANRQKRLQ